MPGLHLYHTGPGTGRKCPGFICARRCDAFALQGLRDLVTYSPGRNVMPVVAAQPWFNDGIDDLETALSTTRVTTTMSLARF